MMLEPNQIPFWKTRPMFVTGNGTMKVRLAGRTLAAKAYFFFYNSVVTKCVVPNGDFCKTEFQVALSVRHTLASVVQGFWQTFFGRRSGDYVLVDRTTYSCLVPVSLCYARLQVNFSSLQIPKKHG